MNDIETEQAGPAYDAIVVGSGFAGSWAAKELTEAGFDALMLEAGPAREPAQVPDRAASYTAPAREDAGAWPRQPVQRSHFNFAPRGPHLFVDDLEHPYETPPGLPYTWIRGMQVGGRSLIWGGSALRLSPFETQAADLDGHSLRWPIGHQDLADAYEAVEGLLGLRGTAEDLAQLPHGRFQGEPPALTPAEADFRRAYRRPGTRPVPVRFVPADAGAGGWPGFTVQATALTAAERTGRLTLRPDARVTSVTTDPVNGRATGVDYVDVKTGRRHHARARVVFLCGGTIETARLMLNSHGPRHPRGLGNSSGWLGRGLMDHPLVTSSGVLPGYSPGSVLPAAGRQCGLLVPPAQPGKGDVRPFALWVTLQRGTGDGAVRGGIDAQGEMLPYWHNRVRLGDKRDRWGVPVPVIDCGYGPHEERLYGAMRQEVELAASIAGLKDLSVARALTAPGRNVHDLGTARMGDSPADSVLDRDNRCWDAPNVFVADGACFPSGGWQNPTLTIMALAARAGRCAARLLRDGEC
ncbi:GMC family oxidoreductase [Streptomyces sp. NEAU-sy36]|uniref:GMC oxidoreductase n=1 Tax=unclassified Streptomyces TaxID=2593676 RepID=UPI0015D5F9A2|nr:MULTISPECIES: GMC family oxidoreductase [unclassified Streptomyces]QLJ03534.1 GMC family oxidoreductase [Streptomyces sp. NEAU-sy36]